MNVLQRLFKPPTLTDEQKQAQGARLDAKRRHLRGKMSRLSGEIRRSWTEYRTWRGNDADKKKLRQHIKGLEAQRKDHVKEMLKLQGEMKRLGYQAEAGTVDMSG